MIAIVKPVKDNTSQSLKIPE